MKSIHTGLTWRGKKTMNSPNRPGKKLFDLSDRKKIEIALESGNIGMWEWDVTLNTVVWSPTLHTIHGIGPDKFKGTFKDYLKDVHPLDRKDLLTTIRKTISDKKQSTYEVSYRIITPDATTKWLQARGKIFRNSKGKAMKMLGICRDITERIVSNQRLDAQYVIAATLAHAPDPDTAYSSILSIIGHMFELQVAQMWVLDSNTKKLHLTHFWY